MSYVIKFINFPIFGFRVVFLYLERFTYKECKFVFILRIFMFYSKYLNIGFTWNLKIEVETQFKVFLTPLTS